MVLLGVEKQTAYVFHCVSWHKLLPILCLIVPQSGRKKQLGLKECCLTVLINSSNERAEIC